MSAVPVRSPMPQALAGQTVVLIGGSSGIGLAAARLLHQIGARVALLGRDESRMAAAAAKVGKEGGSGELLEMTADGGDQQRLSQIFDELGSIDHILVTSGTTAAGPIADTSRAEVETVIESRLWAAYTVARLAAKRLPAGGSLTFTTGTYGVRPQPGMSMITATIGAVESLVRSLALELAPQRIRINAIRPGSTDTPLLRRFLPTAVDPDQAVAKLGQTLPLGRVGTAEEAAAVALFLMSNLYITGTVIPVDGGQTLI